MTYQTPAIIVSAAITTQTLGLLVPRPRTLDGGFVPFIYKPLL